ncbi:MAG: segregation/condensation protein A [Phycisphaerales bacterium]|nr:segregation/condensation protein A [Phycisphaerales bacterium]
MVADGYRFELEAFNGPLDLLLELIRRAEVDIVEIPIAQIADQYIEIISHAEAIDMDQAGDFLVMAATLMEIKSRTIAPIAAADDLDGSGTGQSGDSSSSGITLDPRVALVQQLLDYQRFRSAAEQLVQQRDAFGKQASVRCLSNRSGAQEEEEDELNVELDDVHLLSLSEPYQRIISSIDFDRLGDHRIEIDDTPIEIFEADIMDHLSEANTSIELDHVFQGRAVQERIGLFLATLELVRTRRVHIDQEEPFGTIVLSVLEDVSRDEQTQVSIEPPVIGQ